MNASLPIALRTRLGPAHQQARDRQTNLVNGKSLDVLERKEPSDAAEPQYGPEQVPEEQRGPLDRDHALAGNAIRAREYPQHHVRRDLTRHQHDLPRPRDRLLVAEAKGRKIHLAREEDPTSAFRGRLGAAVRAPCDVPVLVAQDALARHFQVRVHVGVKAGVFGRGPDAYDAPDADGKGPAYRQDLAADALRLAARLPFGAESGEPHAPCRDAFSDPFKGRSWEV